MRLFQSLQINICIFAFASQIYLKFYLYLEFEFIIEYKLDPVYDRAAQSWIGRQTAESLRIRQANENNKLEAQFKALAKKCDFTMQYFISNSSRIWIPKQVFMRIFAYLESNYSFRSRLRSQQRTKVLNQEIFKKIWKIETQLILNYRSDLRFLFTNQRIWVKNVQ